MVLNNEGALAIMPTSGTAQHWPGTTLYVDMAALSCIAPASAMCVLVDTSLLCMLETDMYRLVHLNPRMVAIQGVVAGALVLGLYSQTTIHHLQYGQITHPPSCASAAGASARPAGGHGLGLAHLNKQPWAPQLGARTLIRPSWV